MRMAFSNEFQFSGVKVLHTNGTQAQKPLPCCSTCGQKSYFYVSQVDAAGNVVSKAFCLSHAFQSGLMHPKAWDLLGKLPTVAVAKKEAICRCGMTESLLRNKGRVGCQHCYQTFATLITPLLKKIHDASVHAGKAPRKAAPRINVRQSVEVLQLAMSRAIKQESYEEAAVIRDQISKLSKTPKTTKTDYAQR